MLFNLTDIPAEEFNKELPSTLSEMVGVVSQDAILKLVEAYGGQKIYIPSKADPQSKLAQVVTENDLKVLCKHYHGCEVVVPKMQKLRTQFRDRQIIKDRDEGMNINELASKYNRSARQIQNILSRSEAHDE